MYFVFEDLNIKMSAEINRYLTNLCADMLANIKQNIKEYDNGK